MSTTRRLAALMFTDMVGYSALARDDEQMARELVDRQRAIIRESLARHGGREHQTTGDGFFLEFSSAVNAVQCAIDIQTAMHERAAYVPENHRIQIRIGIHLGDILTSEEDLFGNGVNIAARVEPLAKPGGICITRQIHDQVSDRIANTTFKKDGRKTLKNIRGGAEIFHVVLPWQDVKTPSRINATSWLHRRLSLKSKTEILNASVIGLLCLSAFATLMITMGGALSAALRTDDRATREPAEAVGAEPVDLADGWEFRVDADGRWQKFETHASWKHSDLLQGSYKMRKSFKSSGVFKEPAIVLGLITDTHRTFLNGNFIGGSNRSGELAFYAFDSKLLKTDAENVIEIEGSTRKSLNPGLIVLATVGAKLDEFSVVRAKVHENQMSFHFMRNMYFGLTLLVATAAFFFSLVNGTSKPYLYGAIALLLGTLNLAYYSPWVSSTFEYPFLRFLKLVSLVGVPAVLFSAQMRLLGKTRAETTNNVTTGIGGLTIALLILGFTFSASRFIEVYNSILAVGAVYGFLAAIWIVKSTLSTSLTAKSKTAIGLHLGYFAMTLASTVVVFASVKTGAGFISAFVHALTTPQQRLQVTEFGMALPLVFSVFLTVIATVDYITQSRAVGTKRRRESLMLQAVSLMTAIKPFDEVIASLQEELCDFLHAERSTLYVLSTTEGSQETLVAQYLHSGNQTNYEIQRHVSPGQGVLGYVLQYQTPLLISDIRKDRRFYGPDAAYPVGGFESYSSGACMLFPLMAQGRLVGVITFADKRGSDAFNRAEFAAALELSASLGLLLDNQQMRAALTEQQVAV